MQGANLAAHLVLLAIMGAIVCHGSRVRTYIYTRIEAYMWSYLITPYTESQSRDVITLRPWGLSLLGGSIKFDTK